mmetsp:Transcript_76130/g.68260  ORF Transcript_76130/g.68260 Transcript_76130/m.68260 type:complete len:279 (-) Transcript_76130:171-1007(-)
MIPSILLSLCLFFLKANSQLSIRIGNEYEFVWDDSGTESKEDASFWKPKLNPGEAFLSFVAGDGHNAPTQDYIVITSWPTNALANPDGSELVWDDSGSEGVYSVWFYKPTPPAGYICFGDFVSRSESDLSPGGYKCVHQSYVNELTSAGITQLPVWNDEGSGAHDDVSIIKIRLNNNKYPYNYYRMIPYHGDYIPGPYYSLNLTPTPTLPPTSTTKPSCFNQGSPNPSVGLYRQCDCNNGQLLIVSANCGYNMNDCSGKSSCDWLIPNGDENCLNCQG